MGRVASYSLSDVVFGAAWATLVLLGFLVMEPGGMSPADRWGPSWLVAFGDATEYECAIAAVFVVAADCSAS